jgi:hypothetical protein
MNARKSRPGVKRAKAFLPAGYVPFDLAGAELPRRDIAILLEEAWARGSSYAYGSGDGSEAAS